MLKLLMEFKNDFPHKTKIKSSKMDGFVDTIKPFKKQWKRIE